MTSDPPLHVALGPDLRRPSVRLGDPFRIKMEVANRERRILFPWTVFVYA